MIARVLPCCCLLGILATGCHSGQHTESLHDLPHHGIGHVVIFWLKEPGNLEARRKIITASESFRTIEGVLAVRAGTAIPSPRPNVDKSYDVAVLIWFRDGDALENYQADPKHKAMLLEVGPLVERATVYDFFAVRPGTYK